jgi:hypothetical protein
MQFSHVLAFNPVEQEDLSTLTLATEPSGGPDCGPPALMRALLRDAILCVQKKASGVPCADRERVAAEARRWMISRDVKFVFSFESICHVLGIDPDALRQRFLTTRPRSAACRSSTQIPALQDPEDTVTRLRYVRQRGNQTLGPVRRRPRL